MHSPGAVPRRVRTNITQVSDSHDAARAPSLHFPARVKTPVILVGVLVAAPAVALAEDGVSAPAPEAAAPANDEPAAADVARAPLPGEESGRIDEPEGDSVWRDIGQGVLTPPRVAMEVAMAPVRASVWAFDRYQLIDRFKQVFFDDTGTYGLYPILVLDSTYGATIGGRFVHRNVFGEREKLWLRAGTGGQFRVQAEAGLASGLRFGERTQLDVLGEFERRPEDNFFGIGNTAEAMETHFRQEMLRARSSLDVRAVSSLHVTASGALTDLEFEPSEHEPSIETVFNPMTLTGWTGVRNIYGELELRWDQRSYPAVLDRHGAYTSGGYFALFGGRIHQFEAGGDYWRYGGHAQKFWQIAKGPRVISTRFALDAVTGGYEEVAFMQLPQLGGRTLLRGYERERFRDRLAVVGSVEYTWDIGQLLMASLFTDVGRVYPSFSELHYKDMRVGYGVSLQLHRHHGFLGAVSLASSIDGGFFIDLIWDPVFDVEPRVEQR